MKLLREEVEQYLQDQPLARERANKDRGIVNILLARFPLIAKLVKEDTLDKKMLTQFVQQYNSMDRAWRKILEERPELRGKDYGQKDALEQEMQAELGYGQQL